MDFSRLALRTIAAAALALAACGGESLSAGETDAGGAGGQGADGGTSLLEDGGTSLPDGGPDLPPAPGCGDGVIQVAKGENCDDGNSTSGDGCSSQCQVEEGWSCPVPGQACVPPAVCGDGKLDTVHGEECDDGNDIPGDGCDDACQVEEGWACPYPGVACKAARCGDGIVVGSETCEPPGTEGCDANCHVVQGYACDASGCHRTVCGDGVQEGKEACDLGADNAWGKGCTPDCQIELSCPRTGGGLGSACTALCGSGMMLSGDASKECDDGNLAAGDGCSPSCTIEAGWNCSVPDASRNGTLVLPIIYRDFIGNSRRADGSGAPIHPDFNVFNGSGTRELAKEYLDADGKPEFNRTIGVGETGAQLTGESNFRLWYRDEALGGVTYSKRVTDSLTLTKVSDTPVTYQFSSTGFFPLDGKGWCASGDETVPAEAPHNFSFTSEVHYWFQFQGGEVLSFYGDDDLWVFVNGRMALDLGGLHSQQLGSFTINADGTITSTAFTGTSRQYTFSNQSFGLVKGGIYEIAIFHAERMQTGSNYQLTLAGFNAGTSICTPICGDGIVTSAEACDDGEGGNDGSYGKCLPGCQGYGPRCGDGNVDDAGGEECDDGPLNGTDGSECSIYCTKVGGGGFM